MTPDELGSVDLRVAERSYYMKAPWRRIVVILAGPAVNLVTAFVLFAIVLMAGNLNGEIAIGNLASSQNTVKVTPTTKVGEIESRSGASGHLRLGDRIVSVDGQAATPTGLTKLVDAHRCAGAPTGGCASANPARVTVDRGGRTLTLNVTPHYSKADKRMLLGVGLDSKYAPIHFGLFSALGTSVAAMWDTGISTVTHYFDALVSTKDRRQLQSAVGIAQDTQQAVSRGAGLALVVLALVSLVLAVVNLFPFLPLDGGHVVWSLAEKLRRRRVSVATMWRFSTPGLLLLGFLVISGISNDVSRLGG
jgi:regulator of sigma E protease